MKTALFMGHSYHEKTKSSAFIIELLSLTYDVTSFYSSPYEENTEIYQPLEGQKYDILICWQILPPRQMLDNYISYDHGVFFPMYDDAPASSSKIWQNYSDFLIVCFCRKLHNDLLKSNLNSKYIQYFPKPLKNLPLADTSHNENCHGDAFLNKSPTESPDKLFAKPLAEESLDNIPLGDESSIFFWQRRANVNCDTIHSVLRNNNIKSLHVHKSLDPKEVFVEPDKYITWNTTFSQWFPEKSDLVNKMAESAIYFAPRLSEGIGMSFLDAMAMGRCIIASDDPTMNEYIQHGKTGYLYDFHSISPILLGDIRSIQKNTIEYMHEGYTKWQGEKIKITQWIEEYIQNNAKLVSQKITTSSILSLLFQRTLYSFLALFIGGKKGKFYKWKSLFLKKLSLKRVTEKNYP